MIYLQFLIGFIMYTCLASATYSESFKASNWYYPAGVAAAIVANLIWLWIGKLEANPSVLVIKGLYWDSMLTATYILVPILFFGAKVSTFQIFGIAFIGIGLILTKF